MKTAEKILIKEFKDGNCEDITSNPDPDFNLPFYQSITRLMKEYGRQCAEQALKDAAERATAHKESRFPSVDYCECYTVIDKQSITSTPIVTL